MRDVFSCAVRTLAMMTVLMVGLGLTAAPASASGIVASDTFYGKSIFFGTPLAGRTTEIGDLVWAARAGVGTTGGLATNLDTTHSHIAGVPFSPTASGTAKDRSTRRSRANQTGSASGLRAKRPAAIGLSARFGCS